MGKRIGRKRLFALNKLGQANTNSAGNGILTQIKNQTNIRSGAEIITEFQVALSGASSFAATGGGDGGAAVVGVSSSTGTHENAQLILVEKATHGVVSMVELICVETPTTGEDAIGLYYGNSASGSGAATDDTGTTKIVPPANLSVGTISAGIEFDADIDGKYLYLASTGSTAGFYDGGKVIVRLFGYNDFE